MAAWVQLKQTGTSKWPGVVSAAIAMSDVKDEIDWEWTGKSLNDAQTNVWFLGVANCEWRLAKTSRRHRAQSDGYRLCIAW